ncbi:hypothetical protein [Burkholderia cepacia]|uniref:hypothetical protein n=1 Tax=Burkholderia cepacia TaxID=292 RepID=UPI000F59D03E|nr:hypothetical protein [Burkholderia cepacia]
MTSVLTTVVASSGLTIATASLIGWLARNSLLDLIKGGIKLNYDKQLETIKSKLLSEIEVLKADRTRDTAMLGLVHKSVTDSLSHAQEQRIAAISALWSAVLQLRKSMPPIFVILDCITESEYEEFLARKNIDLPTQEDTRFLGNEPFSSIEQQRIFFGEYLWSLYNAYTLIHARAIFRLLKELGGKDTMPWYRDEPSRRVVRSLLTDDEFKQFEALEISQMAFIRAHIEAKFIGHANRVLNGAENGAEAMRQAAAINAEVSAAQARSK